MAIEQGDNLNPNKTPPTERFPYPHQENLITGEPDKNRVEAGIILEAEMKKRDKLRADENKDEETKKQEELVTKLIKNYNNGNYPEILALTNESRENEENKEKALSEIVKKVELESKEKPEIGTRKKTPYLIGMGKKDNEALVKKGHFSDASLEETLINNIQVGQRLSYQGDFMQMSGTYALKEIANKENGEKYILENEDTNKKVKLNKEQFKKTFKSGELFLMEKEETLEEKQAKIERINAQIVPLQARKNEIREKIEKLNTEKEELNPIFFSFGEKKSGKEKWKAFLRIASVGIIDLVRIIRTKIIERKLEVLGKENGEIDNTLKKLINLQQNFINIKGEKEKAKEAPTAVVEKKEPMPVKKKNSEKIITFGEGGEKKEYIREKPKVTQEIATEAKADEILSKKVEKISEQIAEVLRSIQNIKKEEEKPEEKTFKNGFIHSLMENAFGEEIEKENIPEKMKKDETGFIIMPKEKIKKEQQNLIGMGEKANEALVKKEHFSDASLKETLMSVNNKEEKPIEKEPTKEKEAENEESNTQKVIEKRKKQEETNKLKKEKNELEKKMAKRDLEIEELLKFAETLPDEEFSTDFIKEKVNSLLKSIKSIREIKKEPNIEGNANQITLTTSVSAKKYFITVKNIDIKIVLENKGNYIGVKNYEIIASSSQKDVEEAIIPELDKISELLKSYIEKERGKKVEKIWIEDGELKVLYTKS